jgi:hypothetical protein
MLPSHATFAHRQQNLPGSSSVLALRQRGQKQNLLLTPALLFINYQVNEMSHFLKKKFSDLNGFQSQFTVC